MVISALFKAEIHLRFAGKKHSAVFPLNDFDFAKTDFASNFLLAIFVIGIQFKDK
jgi:hypothetical protein